MDAATLSSVLAPYNLNLSLSQLKTLLSSKSFVQWATTHLDESTLLHPSELTAYETLVSSGFTTNLSPPDLSLHLHLRPHDLPTATATLRHATHLLTSQTHTLSRQATALQHLSSKSQIITAAHASAATHHQHAVARDIALTQERIAELQGYIRVRREESGVTGLIGPTVGTLLAGDDRLLQSLTKLLPALQSLLATATTLTGEQDSITPLAHRAIHLTVLHLRTHLDYTYLHHLTSPLLSEDPNLLLESTDALKAEIETLYSEVHPVAQMSIQSLFLDPVSEISAAQSATATRRAAAGLRYISDILSHLLRRVSTLESRIDNILQHTAATALLHATASSSALLDPPSPSSPSSSHSPSPSPPPPQPPSLPPTFLQTLSTLSLPIPTTPSDLHTPLVTRLAKLNTLHSALQTTSETLPAQVLTDSFLHVRDLQVALTCDHPFNPVTLRDPDTEETLEWLKTEVEMMARKVAEIPAAETHMSEKKKEFVETWA